MSREGGGDTQVRAEFTVVCWAEPWCADYCCVSEFRGQRCMCAASKSALTTLKPRGLEWKALQHQWKLKLGKVSIVLFLLKLKTTGENSFSVQPLPLYVKVVFMPPCCDCSRPGVFDCSVALERLYSAAPTAASPDGRPWVWSTRGDAAAVSHCVY